MATKEDTPNADDYRLLIEKEWADFHHSRTQEWTALGVVSGIHLAIIHLFDTFKMGETGSTPSVILVGGSLLGIVFAVVGGLVTCRHERLKKIKIQWIARAEHFRGLLRTDSSEKPTLEDGSLNPRIILCKIPLDEDIPWDGLSCPRLLSTSWLILCFYGFMVLVDTVFLFSPMWLSGS